MIAKRFSISSAGVPLENVIRKNYEMFRHETSMRKPFFSKATCRKKNPKLSEKLLTRLVSMNILTDTF